MAGFLLHVFKKQLLRRIHGHAGDPLELVQLLLFDLRNIAFHSFDVRLFIGKRLFPLFDAVQFLVDDLLALEQSSFRFLKFVAAFAVFALRVVPDLDDFLFRLEDHFLLDVGRFPFCVIVEFPDGFLRLFYLCLRNVLSVVVTDEETDRTS